MGAANVAMPSNTNGKRLPWLPNTELPSMQEVNDNDNEEDEEMKDTESEEPMEVEDSQGAGDDVSLAFFSGNTQPSVTKAGEVAGPTCHQTMEDSLTNASKLEEKETTADKEAGPRRSSLVRAIRISRY
jgi:hypothetical protein